MKHYQKDQLDRIAFPLGGIGTGSISLGGNGILVDPEINNRPDREKYCGFSGFAVRAEKDGQTVDCRLLCGDRTTDMMGTLRGVYGGGDSFFAGFRHFSQTSFSSAFPFAKVDMADEKFPAKAQLEAFNPFIPSNDRDSSMPAAFFCITLTNTSSERMTYSVLLNMTNLLEEGGKHEYWQQAGLSGITLNSQSEDMTLPTYGNITIATDAEETSHTSYWFRGNWFDGTTMFKNDLLAPGPLKDRVYDTPCAVKGHKDTATLCASAELKPGESRSFRFLISWYVPIANCYWKEEKTTYKNYYATLFTHSADVARYAFANWERLYQESLAFSNGLFSSDLPEVVLDAINGNLAILKSTTCLRLEDGSFWGWEGVWRSTGSCEGSCQHVYNYAYALAFLFPKLEKGIRENEMGCCLDADGKMNFRMPITLKLEKGWRACADGQMGFVIKCYREWKLSGDNHWLQNHWEKIKLALSYAWSQANPDRWDPDKSGVLSGRQHHTLDVELFGVYAWLTGMYRAALFAAAEMADFLKDSVAADEYRAMLQKGQKSLEDSFNGEYYVQMMRVEDKQKIESFAKAEGFLNAWEGETLDLMKYYWDDEIGQVKYQIEDGCEIDQVLAAWHGDLVGLPPVFDPAHRKSALSAIYKYNFCAMHDLLNPCRVFACNDEKGVVMCQWPSGVRKPAIPIPYSEECMSGFEYAVAANMLQCGMEEEALQIVTEIRRRYDGKRRNPFAELECGASYTRALASYSFLLVYSGFQFDLPHKLLGFRPLKGGSYFWSVDGAWGRVNCQKDKWDFTLSYGQLSLAHFVTSLSSVIKVEKNGTALSFTRTETGVDLDVSLQKGDVLTLYSGS